MGRYAGSLVLFAWTWIPQLFLYLSQILFLTPQPPSFLFILYLSLQFQILSTLNFKDLVLSDDISVLGAIRNLEDTKKAMVSIAQGAEADSQDSGRQTGDGTGRHSTWYSMA